MNLTARGPWCTLRGAAAPSHHAPRPRNPSSVTPAASGAAAAAEPASSERGLACGSEGGFASGSVGGSDCGWDDGSSAEGSGRWEGCWGSSGAAGGPPGLPPGCELALGDLCRPGDVERACRGVHTVFHLAANSRLAPGPALALLPSPANSGSPVVGFVSVLSVSLSVPFLCCHPPPPPPPSLWGFASSPPWRGGLRPPVVALIPALHGWKAP